MKVRKWLANKVFPVMTLAVPTQPPSGPGRYQVPIICRDVGFTSTSTGHVDYTYCLLCGAHVKETDYSAHSSWHMTMSNWMNQQNATTTALATAIDELQDRVEQLLDIANTPKKIPRPKKAPDVTGDPGGNNNSVGLFQQQPGTWSATGPVQSSNHKSGSAVDINTTDPRAEARKSYMARRKAQSEVTEEQLHSGTWSEPEAPTCHYCNVPVGKGTGSDQFVYHDTKRKSYMRCCLSCYTLRTAPAQASAAIDGTRTFKMEEKIAQTVLSPRGLVKVTGL